MGGEHASDNLVSSKNMVVHFTVSILCREAPPPQNIQENSCEINTVRSALSSSFLDFLAIPPSNPDFDNLIVDKN